MPYGHAAVVGGYDSNYRIITWGKETTLTPEYWNGAYKDDPKHPNVFEAYVVIWPEHFGTRRFMQGVNLKQLAEQFKEVTKTDMDIPASQLISLYRCSNLGESKPNVVLQISDALNSFAVTSDPITTGIT